MFIKENKKPNYRIQCESEVMGEIKERSGTVEHYVKNMYFPPSKQGQSDETTKDGSQQDIINIVNQLQGKIINS